MRKHTPFRAGGLLAAALIAPAVMACSDSDSQSSPSDDTAAEDAAGLGNDAATEDTAGLGDDTTGDDLTEPDAVAPDAVAPDAVAPDAVAPDAVAPSPLLPVYTLGAKAFPESVEFDPTTRRFFTASLELGNVLETDGVTGESQVFFAGNGEAGWLGLGLQVDAARRRLWVCVGHEKALDHGEVWQLDLDTGTRLAQLDLSDTAESGGCTDFALADDGGVFVTDRQNPRIFHISGGETPAVTVAVEDPALAPAVIGQNGIVIHPNQQILISGKYLPIRLVRSDLSDPASPVVTELEMDTSFLAAGADDLALFDGKLYAIVEDRVAEISFEDALWNTVKLVRTLPLWEDGEALVGGFSGIVVAEGALYASRSDVVLWGFGQESTRPFMIRAIPGLGTTR